MLDYIYGHDEIVADFVAKLIPMVSQRGFGRCKTIGVINERGHLICGAVYHNFDPVAGVIQISGAALADAPWLTRETLRRVYDYPFKQLGCQMVVMMVMADDERVLGQLAALGYAFITIPRLYGREQDGVVAMLTQEAWDKNPINLRINRQPQPLKEAA